MVENEKAKNPQDSLEVNLINLSQTRKPVIDYAGMIIVGADLEEFPELKYLPTDPDD